MTGIVLSGNRMPLLLFFLLIFIIFIFQQNIRKFFISFLIVSSLLLFLIINFNTVVKKNFDNFYTQISNMVVVVINKDLSNDKTPQYFNEFKTFYDTWLMNKYLGGGIKGFRFYCHKRPNIEKNSKFVCNMHPHNYYLEILTETGIVGFSILITIMVLILKYSIIKKKLLSSLDKRHCLINPFLFLFIVEIFPLKSTGSFFTTGNTTYLFLIISILIGLIREHNSIENKH